jgi:hypothetical protein
MRSRFLLLLTLGLCSSACGSRTLVESLPCPDEPPLCIQSPSGCDAPEIVAATCGLGTSHWACPSGARVRESVTGASGSCLPFHEPGGPISQLGGSFARVPIDGERCLWVAETLLTTTGSAIRNVGFVADLSEPLGSCPLHASFLGGSPASAVTIAGSDDPSIVVQVDGGYRIDGLTRVLYRLFQLDSSETFGVKELGSGLGTWDASSQQIVVPGPAALDWQTNIDLGDATLVAGGVPYVWGCHGPTHFLTDSCDLARLDPAGTAELFAGSGGWVLDTEAAKAVSVFDSGPWISSVAPSESGGFVHVYAVGFGGTLETHTAPAVTGPWTSGATLATCVLPGGDSHAFCAGPVVHEELEDPTSPGRMVVSYGVGTTALDQDALLAAHPEEYWTRLVRVGVQ